MLATTTSRPERVRRPQRPEELEARQPAVRKGERNRIDDREDEFLQDERVETITHIGRGYGSHPADRRGGKIADRDALELKFAPQKIFVDLVRLKIKGTGDRIRMIAATR